MSWNIKKCGALARLLRQVPGQYFSVLLLAQANRLYLHVVEGCYLDQFEDYLQKYLKPEYQLTRASFWGGSFCRLLFKSDFPYFRFCEIIDSENRKSKI